LQLVAFSTLNLSFFCNNIIINNNNNTCIEGNFVCCILQVTVWTAF